MALSWISQDDFAAGVLRSVGRDMDTGIGVSNAVNGLFDDDGDCYLRGNTRSYAPGSDPLTFIWTGFLGTATGLVSSATHLYRLDPDLGLVQLTGGTPVLRPCKPAIVAGELFLPNGTSWKGAATSPLDDQLPAPLPGMSGSIQLASCGERLVIGQGRFVRFSEAGKPRSWLADDFHELGEGVEIRGLATIKDTLLVFTGYGIWAIENMALDLTDDFGNPQQVVQKIAPELGLLHESGLAEWGGRIVAPCSDRVFLVDTISAPTPISDSISPLYQEHIRAGRLPGGAKVYRNHYFLPWLNSLDVPVATMACRLNRPVKARMTYFPWSVLTGHAEGMAMGDIAAVTDIPTLLVAHSDGSVANYLSLFEPDETIVTDADGTTPEFDLETRDFPTGNGQPNHLRALRLYYTLKELPNQEATIGAAFTSGMTARTYEQLRAGVPDYEAMLATFADYETVRFGGSEALWPPSAWAEDRDLFWTPLAERALESPGVEPAQWILQQPKRLRYVRVRFRCSDPVAKLVVHRIGLGVRPATHQR